MDLAVDAKNVYCADNFHGKVLKVPIDGGNVTTLASDTSHPLGLAIDGTTVYWRSDGGGAVKSVPIGGGEVTTLVESTQGGEGEVVVDAKNVYWIDAVPAGSGR